MGRGFRVRYLESATCLITHCLHLPHYCTQLHCYNDVITIQTKIQRMIQLNLIPSLSPLSNLPNLSVLYVLRRVKYNHFIDGNLEKLSG